MAQLLLTAAKLTCLCNTLRASNSFARSYTGVVIDREPHVQNLPLFWSIGLSFVDLMPRMIQLNLTDASRADVEYIKLMIKTDQ